MIPRERIARAHREPSDMKRAHRGRTLDEEIEEVGREASRVLDTVRSCEGEELDAALMVACQAFIRLGRRWQKVLRTSLVRSRGGRMSIRRRIEINKGRGARIKEIGGELVLAKEIVLGQRKARVDRLMQRLTMAVEQLRRTVDSLIGTIASTVDADKC